MSTMTWTRTIDLRPRAVAILVALRRGPRNDAELQHAIADATLAQTQDMTRCLGSALACRTVGAPGALIVQHADDVRWVLTGHGIEWLRANDLTPETT